MTYKYGTVVSTDTAVTPLATLSLQTDSTNSFCIEAHGCIGTTTCGVVRIVGAVRNIGGTATVLGAPVVQVFADAAGAAWTGSATASAGNLLVSVQGGVGQLVEWTICRADLAQMNVPPPRI